MTTKLKVRPQIPTEDESSTKFFNYFLMKLKKLGVSGEILKTEENNLRAFAKLLKKSFESLTISQGPVEDSLRNSVSEKVPGRLSAFRKVGAYGLAAAKLASIPVLATGASYVATLAVALEVLKKIPAESGTKEATVKQVAMIGEKLLSPMISGLNEQLKRSPLKDEQLIKLTTVSIDTMKKADIKPLAELISKGQFFMPDKTGQESKLDSIGDAVNYFAGLEMTPQSVQVVNNVCAHIEKHLPFGKKDKLDKSAEETVSATKSR